MGERRTGLITVPKRNQRYKLRVGIDLDNPRAHNAIGYVRFVDMHDKDQGVPKTVGTELWLTLEDMDKLGTLLLLYSRFWAKTRHKGEENKEVTAFVKFWKLLRSEWPTIKPFIPEEEED